MSYVVNNHIRWSHANAIRAMLALTAVVGDAADEQRIFAHKGYRPVVVARAAVRTAFHSRHAVSVIEHALFGLGCCVIGYVMVHWLHQIVVALQEDSGNGRPPGHIATAVRRKIFGLASLTPARVKSGLRRLKTCLQGDWWKKRWLTITFKWVCTGFSVYLLWLGKHAAYGKWDIIVAIPLFALMNWLIWRHRHLFRFNEFHPGVMMLAFALVVWLDGDVAWKIHRIQVAGNSVAHAVVHAAVSLLFILLGIVFFRFSVMRLPSDQSSKIAGNSLQSPVQR